MTTETRTTDEREPTIPINSKLARAFSSLNKIVGDDSGILECNEGETVEVELIRRAISRLRGEGAKAEQQALRQADPGMADHHRAAAAFGAYSSAIERGTPTSQAWIEVAAALSAAPGAPQPETSPTPLDARQLFDPNRLPERDAEGRLTHPDFGRLVSVEDEWDVTPFFHAAGMEFRAVTHEWPDDDDNDGCDMNWLTPEAPAGDGWRLVSIHDTEDGEGVVWWARYVGREAINAAAAPRVPEGWALVPERANREWAEAYCAHTNRDPDGEQWSSCDGQMRSIAFRDLAAGEINAMLAAAPKPTAGEDA